MSQEKAISGNLIKVAVPSAPLVSHTLRACLCVCVCPQKQPVAVVPEVRPVCSLHECVSTAALATWQKLMTGGDLWTQAGEERGRSGTGEVKSYTERNYQKRIVNGTHVTLAYIFVSIFSPRELRGAILALLAGAELFDFLTGFI